MLDMAQVPYLTKANIAWQAYSLLQEIGQAQGSPVTPPIPVDEIIEFHLGLNFKVDNLKQLLGMDDVLGATWMDDNKVIIDENVEHEGRFMFTCGHEIGHWQLHRPLIEAARQQMSLFDAGDPKPTIVCRKQEKKKRGEWQADYFSSCILMPEEMVLEAFRKVHGDKRIVITGENKVSILGIELSPFAEARQRAEEIRQVGGFDNVSNEAMTYRLSDLGLVVYPREGERITQTDMVQ